MCVCHCLLFACCWHHRCYYQPRSGCLSSSLQCQLGILTFEKRKKAWRRLESSSWHALSKARCAGLEVTDLGSCSGFAFTGHVNTDKALSLSESQFPICNMTNRSFKPVGEVLCPFPGYYLILSPLGKSEMQNRCILYRAVITSVINMILMNIKWH